MKTVKFSAETVLVDQLVLDHKADLLLNIYQMGKKYAFRYLSSSKETLDGRVDPISNNSVNFSWGYGNFDSPTQAHEVAQDYYINHGFYQLK